MVSPEACNSRSLSWLVKSCLPSPHPSDLRRKTTFPSRPSDQDRDNRNVPSLSSLPDDLLFECLSRVPSSSLPSLPLVCCRWARCLSSPAFYSLRRNHLLLCPTVFAVSVSDFGVFVASRRFGPAEGDETWNWKTSLFASDALFSSPATETLGASLAHARLAAVGPAVYILGRGATVRYDAWTGNAAARSPMLFPRKKFAAAAVAGKIYVCGGCRTADVEEYDPAADSWRVVAEAPRKRYGCIGVAVDGVFYAIGGLRIGSGGGVAEYAGSMDAYDVSAGAWLRTRHVPGGGCVVAACGVAGDGGVYVVASHAVELSFWRCEGRRGSAAFGEWRRLRPPPVPAQVRLDGTVRFSCVEVGQSGVALVQVAGSIDDLLRRSGRSERGLRDGLVLIYDCGSGEWIRGPDLPEALRRAACVSVDC